MFSLPSTPAVQTRSAARSRYNSDTSPAHSQSSFPPPIDPALTNGNHNNQTTSATPTRARDHTNSVSSVRSTDHTTSPSQSATAISPTYTGREGYAGLHTPFVQHAAPPSANSTPQGPQQQQQVASPTHMPGYHPDTPSPPATYGGINGANLVVSETSVMPSSNGVACQPLGSDVFSSGKSQSLSRPALRSTHSHNGVLTPSTNTFTSWSRRIVGDDINNSNGNTRSVPAPISVGQGGPETHPLALSATYPNTPLSQQGSIHDSSAPFSSSIPATHGAGSAYPPPPPSAASHPHHHSSSHTQPMSIGGTASYSDQEVSFQSSGYGSYESSFGSNSPWTPQSAETGYPHHHPYYTHIMSSKIEEPILAPGEVPAPRPPMSYAALIGEALLLAPPPHQLYVSEISDSIKKRYAYYRQNPTKVYNGVRHQTSMCKAFVKLPRPFGDQSGGARKWAIRAGCETWFQGGGYHPPGSNAAANMKKAGSPPLSSNSNGKAKQTARSKQLAIGTSSSHSPKLSSGPKIKTEPYIPSLGGGPSVGPAYDGSGKPYYPAYGHANVPQYNHYGGQPAPQGGYYAYQPIPYGHAYGQPQWPPYGASNPPAPGSPASQNDHSPQVSAAAYHGYAYPSPYSQPGAPPPSYAPQPDYKPYNSMAPPHMSHHPGPGFPQSDERPHTQGSHGSQASYDGKLSPDTNDRAASAELSPRH